MNADSVSLPGKEKIEARIAALTDQNERSAALRKLKWLEDRYRQSRQADTPPSPEGVKALETLPRLSRQLLYDYYINGMDIEDICHQRHISVIQFQKLKQSAKDQYTRLRQGERVPSAA